MSQAPDGDDQMRQGLDPGIAVFLILDDLQTANKASKTKPKLGLKIWHFDLQTTYRQTNNDSMSTNQLQLLYDNK